MYEIQPDKLLIAHDAHPQYVSTLHALELEASEKRATQHHRAHIASVIAERGAWDQRVIGVSFDGTGYGDDQSIWGGEIFAGSVRSGFERVAHLRKAILPGGDAASSYPLQAAAGYLEQLDDLPNVMSQPFSFGARYRDAVRLVRKNMRTFPTTSMGRLFDTAAALAGFTRESTFEGQAAMWLERLAWKSPETEGYPLPYSSGELDFRPLLESVVRDRVRGRDVREIARAFHRGIALGLRDALTELCSTYHTDTIALSGGVFQNEMLLSDLKSLLERDSLIIWTNRAVPANDGGISLGQATLAAFGIPEVFGLLGEEDSKCAERAA
jgi:hydrogenase maturation protein HypF